MEQLYTTHDIAKLIQVDPSTVSKWIDKGILLAFKTPGKHRRVRAGDLRSFLIKHQMPIPEELGAGLVKLLVIDDEPKSLEAVKRAFKPFADRVEVLGTTSGIDGLFTINEQKPNGAIIDLKLEDIDGMEVCRRIRARQGLDGVTVIAFTANWSPAIEAQALKAGAVACLPKPLDVQKVLEHFRVAQGMAVRA